MSTTPDSDLNLDLHFLPAWAKQSPETNRYAKFEGEAERPGRYRDERGRRPDGEHRRGPRNRPSGPDRGPRNRPPSPPRGDRRPDRGYEPGRPREMAPAAPPLPDLDVALIPEDKGVESLARQIKLTGRAYPLFEIAHLILSKPERYHAIISVVKKPDGQPAQPLFLCNLDDSLWLSEEEAISHVLRRHFETFYQAERTPTDPPKGTYTFVAQCGMSGVILGPPNYHDYQNQLRKIHAERFGRMPFEAFKSRVKIVKDEAVVKKWVEDQSWRTEYICLNVPEPLKLGTRVEVEAHFRAHHAANLIRPVASHSLSATAGQALPQPALRQLLRMVWDDQMRFPLKMATILSQQFATHGLQFFKVNKTVTYVSVARPRFLDLTATPVSDAIKRIIDFINATPGCTHQKLLAALAPTPPPPAREGAAAPTTPPPAAEPSAEQQAISADLHWLIHEGHVLEFANGVMETAKRPLPKLVKAAPSQPSTKAATGTATVKTTVDDTPPVGSTADSGYLPVFLAPLHVLP